MKTINPETKNGKLFSALLSGERLTEAAITKKFSIRCPRAEIHRIRHAGYVVNTTHRKAGNHVHVTEYAMGHPTRELIAAGYKAMALGIA